MPPTVHHLWPDDDPPAVEYTLVDPMTLGYDHDPEQTPEERAVLTVHWRWSGYTLSGPPDLVAAHLHEVGLRALRCANDFASGHAGLGVVEPY